MVSLARGVYLPPLESNKNNSNSSNVLEDSSTVFTKNSKKGLLMASLGVVYCSQREHCFDNKNFHLNYVYIYINFYLFMWVFCRLLIV